VNIRKKLALLGVLFGFTSGANADDLIEVHLSSNNSKHLDSASFRALKFAKKSGATSGYVVSNNEKNQALIETRLPEGADIDAFVESLRSVLGTKVKIERVAVDRMAHGTQDFRTEK
jgi:hypothetical protein